MRSKEGVVLLLENLQYAWYRAKIAVLQYVVVEADKERLPFKQDIVTSEERAYQLLELRKHSENLAALSVALSRCKVDEYQYMLREFFAYWQRLARSAASLNLRLDRD
ncbi:hypothetical protein [Brucella sp. NBRC 12950]|uniref:hypothetical protein n=1 Tax=Brucella sp. NBRC 12950 TaxID=2994518 RepID=UPI002553AB09|nr:hypothetical protein [Brucella sp. NBRC 12950]